MTSDIFNVEYIQSLDPIARLKTVRAILHASQGYLYSWGVVYDFSRLAAYVTEPRRDAWLYPLPESKRLAMVKFLIALSKCQSSSEVSDVQAKLYTYYSDGNLKQHISLEQLDLLKALIR